MSAILNIPKQTPEDDGNYDLILSEKYHPNDSSKYRFVKEEKLPDNKIINFYENDKREIVFPSGNKKQIYSDGYQCFPDGKIVYFFAQNQSTQVFYPNGLKVFKFKNGQIEKLYTNAMRKIIFPNGTEKIFKEEEIGIMYTQS